MTKCIKHVTSMSSAIIIYNNYLNYLNGPIEDEGP